MTRDNYQQLREEVLRFIAEHLDTTYGGFGTGDKYPQPRLLAYPLELHQATGDRRYLVAVEKSLDGILGALYDPVDGGFFRFAEGRQWRVPHYEKLVHLNAVLAAVLGRLTVLPAIPAIGRPRIARSSTCSEHSTTRRREASSAARAPPPRITALRFANDGPRSLRR